MAEIGDKFTCIHPGSTLLRLGGTYTVVDKLGSDVMVGGMPELGSITQQELYEFAELRGFLFGLWRFRDATENG